jgi:hypothetical protein
MTKKLFIRLELSDKTYKDEVSTAECSNVAVFKKAIKKEFLNLLGAYDAAQLTLLQPDGSTVIDPGEVIEKLNEFEVGPMSPLVVTVEENQQPLEMISMAYGKADMPSMKPQKFKKRNRSGRIFP